MVTCMDIELVRAISTRCFVARRIGHPAIFLVEYDISPLCYVTHENMGPAIKTRVQLSEFDWTRKSFPVRDVGVV